MKSNGFKATTSPIIQRQVQSLHPTTISHEKNQNFPISLLPFCIFNKALSPINELTAKKLTVILYILLDIHPIIMNKQPRHYQNSDLLSPLSFLLFPKTNEVTVQKLLIFLPPGGQTIQSNNQPSRDQRFWHLIISYTSIYTFNKPRKRRKTHQQ